MTELNAWTEPRPVRKTGTVRFSAKAAITGVAPAPLALRTSSTIPGLLRSNSAPPNLSTGHDAPADAAKQHQADKFLRIGPHHTACLPLGK